MLRLWIIIAISSTFCCLSLASQCTSYGRFPNDDIPECRGYIMCIDRGGGVFTQYNLSCPLGFIFNPVEHVCTNFTTYRCLDHPLEYKCPGKGFFVNDITNSCDSYIACIEGISGSIVPRLFNCPEATLFYPIGKNCIEDTEYQCELKNKTKLNTPPEKSKVLVIHSVDIDNVKGSAINNRVNYFISFAMIICVELNKYIL